jgi:hypothetical protein
MTGVPNLYITICPLCKKPIPQGETRKLVEIDTGRPEVNLYRAAHLKCAEAQNGDSRDQGASGAAEEGPVS